MNSQALDDYLLLGRKCEPDSPDLCRTNILLDVSNSIRNNRIKPILIFLMNADDMTAVHLKYNRQHT